MLGRLSINGTGFLKTIAIKALKLKGINGHKYGVFNDLVFTSIINVIVSPIASPGILNRYTKTNRNILVTLFARLSS